MAKGGPGNTLSSDFRAALSALVMGGLCVLLSLILFTNVGGISIWFYIVVAFVVVWWTLSFAFLGVKRVRSRRAPLSPSAVF